jgi:hypothetical protein
VNDYGVGKGNWDEKKVMVRVENTQRLHLWRSLRNKTVLNDQV